MKAPLSASVRQSIIFWITFPIVVTAALVAFIEITGRFFGGGHPDSAAGVMFLAAFVPIIAAHFSFLSAVAGLILLLFGLRPDKKLLMLIALGLVFGAFMLNKIYLS